jgi:hypothetical protein
VTRPALSRAREGAPRPRAFRGRYAGRSARNARGRGGALTPPRCALARPVAGGGSRPDGSISALGQLQSVRREGLGSGPRPRAARVPSRALANRPDVAQTVRGLWFLSRVEKNRCRSGLGFGLANRAAALDGRLAVLRNHGSRFAATLGSPTAAGEVSPTSRRAGADSLARAVRRGGSSLRRPAHPA